MKKMSQHNPDQHHQHLSYFGPSKAAEKKNQAQESGLVKVKIDDAVFQVLRKKKQRGESIRMALERAIMEL
jgi:hypothetical protein